MKRKLKKTAKVLAASVLILVVAHTAITGILAWRVSREIARLRAEGVPVRPADLVPEKVPDEENAAILYVQAASLLDYHDNTLLGYYVSPGPDPGEHPSEAEAEAVIAQHSKCIALMEQAASRPKCQYPVKWEKGPAALFEHPSQLRECQRLLRARVRFYAKRGNTGEAVRLIILQLQLAESLTGRPTNVCEQWTRCAQTGLAADSIRYVIKTSGLTPAQAKVLWQRVARIDLTRETRPAVETEIAIGLSVFDMTRSEWSDFVASFQEPAPLAVGDNAWRFDVPLTIFARNKRLWSPMLYADELWYIRHVRRQLDLANTPYRQLSSSDRRPGDPGVPGFAYVSRPMAIRAIEVQRSRDVSEATLAFVQAALALEAYRAQFGSYPQDLAELRSKLGWKLRKDPFSGQDLHYTRRGRAFTLYSTGPDLVDDRGKECLSPYEPEESGDLIWRSDQPEPPIPKPTKKPQYPMGPMGPGAMGPAGPVKPSSPPGPMGPVPSAPAP